MKIEFFGKSSEDVTGSMNVVTFSNGTKVLVDCGMYQSNRLLKDYLINNSNFPFKVSDIDYVLLTHVHADHAGLLPKLYNRGYKGKIGVVSNSIRLLKHMLEDSQHIISTTCEYLSKKKEMKLIYSEEDVKNTLNHVEEFSYFDKVEIGKDMYFTFIPAGHIALSAQIILHEKNDKLVISGDLGNKKFDMCFCEDFVPIRKCSVFVSECTYGERKRIVEPVDRQKDLTKIYDIVKHAQGRILIPCFSLARTQLVAQMLYEMKVDCKVYIDSPLSKKITEEYSKIYDMHELLSWDKLHIIDDWKDSESLMNDKGKKIILASSGMCNAGRSVAWVQNIASNESDTVLFVGYCGMGTLGRALQEKPLEAKIQQIMYKVNCSIYTFNSFSSHMQREELLEYLSQINCREIVLTHGSENAKIELKEDLEKLLSKLCKTTKITISKKGLVIKV